MENSKPYNSALIDNTFSKDERLSHKRLIGELFKNGSSSFLHPFLIKYEPELSAQSGLHKILISVPKRNFKKAVDRNLVKRRIKEIYRTNKSLVYPADQAYHIAIIYTGKEIHDFKVMKNKLIKVLKRLPIREQD